MGTLLIATQINKRVAVSGYRLPGILEQRFKLREILDDDNAADLPASHGGKQGTKIIRQCHIRKLVQHKGHMNRQPPAVLKVGLIV